MNQRHSTDGDDRFRVQPGTPKQRGDTFVSQVLRQAGLLDLRPGLAMYRTDAEALLALQQLPEAVARA